MSPDRRERRVSQRVEFFSTYIEPFARNKFVSDAFRQIDRGKFTPPVQKRFAYTNQIIPLSEGSSMSQPRLMVEMIEALDPTGEGRVLEIGTASGYGAACLSCCFEQVYTMDCDLSAVDNAGKRLKRLGYSNVGVRFGDGVEGLRDYQPYDAIIVTAGASSIPPSIVEQLSIGGKMVIPVGPDPDNQALIKAVKNEDGLSIEFLDYVRFHELMSPLYGGWTTETIEFARRNKIRMLLKDLAKGVDPYEHDIDAVFSKLKQRNDFEWLISEVHLFKVYEEIDDDTLSLYCPQAIRDSIARIAFEITTSVQSIK